MPKQSRGFWSCEYCGTSFDTYDICIDHEVEDCQQQQRLVSGAAFSPYQQQQSRPQLKQQQQSASPDMAPFEETEKLYDYTFAQKSEVRKFPLLEQDVPHCLAEADAVACKHLELFETQRSSSASYAQHERQQQRAPAQIGLRCLLCAFRTTDEQAEYSLPRAISSLGDAVRRMADLHLGSCTKVPAKDRWVLENASRLRRGAKEEGGPSWHEEEGNRRALTDYCADRCRRLGMVDKLPENSGIELLRSAAENDLDDDSLGVSSIPVQPLPLPSAATERPTATKNRASAPMYSTPNRSRSSSGQQQQSYLSPYHQPYQDVAGSGPLVSSATHHRYHHFSPTRMSPPTATSSADAYYSSGPPPHQPTIYDVVVPANFPFFQDPNEGDWICKFCSHVHPQYRDAHYRWSGTAPPPGDFTQLHLSICRAYHHHHANPSMFAALPPLYHHLGPPTPPYSYPVPPESVHSPWHQQHQHTQQWEPLALSRSQEPAGNRVVNRRSTSPHRPTTSSRHYTTSSPVGGIAPYHPHHTSPHHPSLATAAVHHSDPIRTEDAMLAMDFLIANDKSIFSVTSSSGTARLLPESELLVQDEDKLLLTDFLFYLMKQLRLVRFSEADRKTRGGKRERIQIGYGGLECVHCAHIKKARKFFWSGVDRLANSFAEIPTHVFKCKYCPQPMKDALSTLKLYHADQMARLPRGSQKVFFRRVWQRIHQDDPEPLELLSPEPLALHAKGQPGELSLQTSSSLSKESSPDTKQPHQEQEISPSGTTGTLPGSDESTVMLERPTLEAARALADSAKQSEDSDPPPLSPSSRVLLAIAEDRDFLSTSDCFLRKQLEVFCATKEDVSAAMEDRKVTIRRGQVGVRCVHCAMASHIGARGHAVSYPLTLSGVFESVREFERLHLDYCEHLPQSVRGKISNMKKESTTITSIQRKYYILAAKGLGLYDSQDGVVRAGAESIPVVSHAVFSFSEQSSPTLNVGVPEQRQTIERQQTGWQRSSPSIPPPDRPKKRSIATTPDEEKEHNQPATKKPTPDSRSSPYQPSAAV